MLAYQETSLIYEEPKKCVSNVIVLLLPVKKEVSNYVGGDRIIEATKSCGESRRRESNEKNQNTKAQRPRNTCNISMFYTKFFLTHEQRTMVKMKSESVHAETQHTIPYCK